MSNAIVGIRDYTIEATSFEAYKQWANELAVPWLKAWRSPAPGWLSPRGKAMSVNKPPARSTR